MALRVGRGGRRVSNLQAIATYSRDAEAFAATYEAIAFEAAHQDLLAWIPEQPVRVLDVGAGSGRDAAWFAARGHRIVAVEPARMLHPGAGIDWRAGALPDLGCLSAADGVFGLVWLSAVWMHLEPGARLGALRRLAELLAPEGRMVLTLRQGPSPANRPMFPARAEDLAEMAQDCGLRVVGQHATADLGGRESVWWESVVLGKAVWQ